MHRLILHSRNHEWNEDEDIDTTPLRRSTVRFPRLRLLHKDSKSEEIPKRPTVDSQTVVLKGTTSQPAKVIPRLIPRQTCTADRFISGRCEYNVDAANYLLTKKTSASLTKNELDVFKQVDSLTGSWRKKFMHQLMVKENAIPGLRQKQVLRSSQSSSENKLPGNLLGQPKDPWSEEYFEDGMWKSKPRKRPLISITDSILDMPGFQVLPRSRFRLIDWSSTNFIAALIQNAVTFYDIRLSLTAKPLPLENVEACILKWNHAGDKLAICTTASNISLYDLVTQKILWTVVCKCLLTYKYRCIIRCVCWWYNDQHIVTGCRGFVSVYCAKTGSIINSLRIHGAEILTLSFSSNYQYLVTSASDTSVNILLWPSLNSFLIINYYKPVKAVAWHPYESGLLCIGGGLGDASLSLWNVNKLDSVSYRRVNFYGAVEDLAWNKLSGELVVHWSYWEGRNRYTMMPVLASLDRVVDNLPIDKESRVGFIMWNSDYTQLASLSEQSLYIWNFFGNEHQAWQKQRKIPNLAEVEKNGTSSSFKEFKCFNIR